MTPEFIPFPKMPRLSRKMIITEKIDGTNSSIFIRRVENEPYMTNGACFKIDNLEVWVGSRTRWITPNQDNHGFARWACEHDTELIKLGEGLHFGEWWGSGIQRGYGLSKGEKRLSLFNVQRWALHGTEPKRIETADPRIEKYQEVLPECVGLVPVLYEGEFDTAFINSSLTLLGATGSQAAPGFMNPEGVVAYHVASNFGFKKTLEKDSEPKGTWQK